MTKQSDTNSQGTNQSTSWLLRTAAFAFAFLLCFLVLLALARWILGDSTETVGVIEALLSWPVALSALVVLLASMFRGEVSELLRNLKLVNFGRDGVSIGTHEKVPEQEKAEPSTTPFDSPDFLPRLRNNLDPKQQEFFDHVVKIATFEPIWSQIYRSQLELLMRLDVLSDRYMSHGESLSYLEMHMKAIIMEFPGATNRLFNSEDGLSYEDRYFGFLQSHGLILLNDNRDVQLTPKGSDFLDYFRFKKYSIEHRRF